MKLDIMSLITGADPITLVLLTVVVTYWVIKGVVKLPFIVNKKKRLTDEETHVSCVHYPSMLRMISSAVTKAAKDSTEIARIKHIETLYHQMNEASIAWLEVSDILKDNYYSEISKRAIPEHDREKGIRHFNLLVDNMEKMMMDIVRAWMKAGDFTDKNELEFQAYIDNKIKILIPKISGAIDHGYMRSILWVDMHTLHESSLKCMESIGSAASKFFHRAKGIAIEKRDLIDKIREG